MGLPHPEIHFDLHEEEEETRNPADFVLVRGQVERQHGRPQQSRTRRHNPTNRKVFDPGAVGMEQAQQKHHNPNPEQQGVGAAVV